MIRNFFGSKYLSGTFRGLLSRVDGGRKISRVGSAFFCSLIRGGDGKFRRFEFEVFNTSSLFGRRGAGQFYELRQV